MSNVLGVAGVLICITIGFISIEVMLVGILLVLLGWVGDNQNRLHRKGKTWHSE
jgi:hypothetical protein